MPIVTRHSFTSVACVLSELSVPDRLLCRLPAGHGIWADMLEAPLPVSVSRALCVLALPVRSMSVDPSYTALKGGYVAHGRPAGQLRELLRTVSAEVPVMDGGAIGVLDCATG